MMYGAWCRVHVCGASCTVYGHTMYQRISQLIAQRIDQRYDSTDTSTDISYLDVDNSVSTEEPTNRLDHPG
jgi:hypothetical protein